MTERPRTASRGTPPDGADPGLQGERNALAWRRTALAVGVVGLAEARLVLEHIGALALVAVGVATGMSGWLYYLGSRRYRRTDRSMSGQTPVPDGRPMAALAALMVITAALELGHLLG